jgi:hypothetical protein
MPYTQLLKATNGKNKYTMIFYDHMRKKVKTVHFGAKGYESYPDHQDMNRQQSYIARHKNNENWNDPMTSGSLSRWILWHKPTLSGAYKAYRQRFGFELY